METIIPMLLATNPAITEAMASIHIGDVLHKVVEIRATGDLILDVSFENTNACNKSIPPEAIQKLRNSKSPISSVRTCYRVRIDTLKKQSKYFAQLLGSDVFGEGRSIKATFASLSESNRNRSEIEPDELPRISIIDEDDATRTMGREVVFRDLLRIIHGAEHLSKPVTTNYLAVLVIMADRFDCMAPITRYFASAFVNFKYPYTLDKTAEEILRQKILIFYHTDQAARLASATKEMILRGSPRWVGYDNSSPDFSALWWDLPDGLEAELSYRRICILRTIASLQMHFLALYTSRVRQCTLGYDSSGACDSFQLGEMIKFLSKKGLLALVPFQAVSAEDPDYLWPEAYSGDVEHLIGLLRQCPSYQIDQNHTHCGLRSKMLPALEYVRDCVDTGIGIKVMRWKSERSSQRWTAPLSGNEIGRKPFVVGGEAVRDNPRRIFEFTTAGPVLEFGANDFNVDKSARSIFTAEKWIWTSGSDEEGAHIPRTSLRF